MQPNAAGLIVQHRLMHVCVCGYQTDPKFLRNQRYVQKGNKVALKKIRKALAAKKAGAKKA